MIFFVTNTCKSFVNVFVHKLLNFDTLHRKKEIYTEICRKTIYAENRLQNILYVNLIKFRQFTLKIVMIYTEMCLLHRKSFVKPLCS